MGWPDLVLSKDVAESLENKLESSFMEYDEAHTMAARASPWLSARDPLMSYPPMWGCQSCDAI